MVRHEKFILRSRHCAASINTEDYNFLCNAVYFGESPMFWENIASIFRDRRLRQTRRHQKQGQMSSACRLLLLVSCLAYSFSQKTEAVYSPKRRDLSKQYDMKRHFSIALWMSVRLSATTPASLHGCVVHDETCRGVHWISWRTF
jgi:hypothetical protein